MQTTVPQNFEFELIHYIHYLLFFPKRTSSMTMRQESIPNPIHSHPCVDLIDVVRTNGNRDWYNSKIRVHVILSDLPDRPFSVLKQAHWSHVPNIPVMDLVNASIEQDRVC